MAKKATTVKRGTKRSSSKREFIDTGRNKMFGTRRPDGTFKEMDDVGRGLAADRQRKTQTATTSGHGDKGDRKR